MKIKKILAGAVTAALTVSTLTVNAFAADNLLGDDVNLGTGWGGEYLDTGKFADTKEGDVITVEYVINNEDSYHLVMIASGADGWPKLECSTQAENGQDDAEFRNQDDGFAVVSVDGSVHYTLGASDASTLKSAGMVVRGYDITVKSITVGAPAAEEAEAAEPTEAEASTDTSADADAAEPAAESAEQETAAPAATTAAAGTVNGTTNDKSNADTGVEGVAAAAVIAVVAVLGIVVAKKRK